MGGDVQTDHTYSPTIYATGDDATTVLGDVVDGWKPTHRVGVVRKKPRWRDDPQDVLRIEAASMEDIRPLAQRIRRRGDFTRYRIFNVDLAPQFRYSLETGRSPMPDDIPTTLRMGTTDKHIADRDISPITLDGDRMDGTEADALSAIHARIEEQDPDILRVSHADLVPLLFDRADALDIDLRLGRLPGYDQLAGESTYTQYGKRGHSPARYDVPGRVLINEGNSFFLSETNMDGLLDLIRRSWKPLQEAAWASIGNLLTAMQIRHAHDNDVLVPWRAWEPEMEKSLRDLHRADRGGFTFSPEVGLHEEVYECDYASLYPNIMVTRNVSPDVINCACHDDRENVPGLSYNLCDRDGYLGEVLGPLIDDREAMKRRLREENLDPEEREEVQGRIDAIKWVLVSCFGYQGFSNSKFGRIECHEAINAFAREIMLEGKRIFEDHGYRVLHGIVDSIWVTPVEADPTPVREICDEVTEQVGIRLDYEAAYDWIAFCPKRDSDVGALTRYFGKQRSGDYKVRGIELRQHSTTQFVKNAQRAMLEAIDDDGGRRSVEDAHRRWEKKLVNGWVDPDDLVIEERVSKQPEEYRRNSWTVAALKRAKQQGMPVRPGQRVEYVVIREGDPHPSRVRLAWEEPEGYAAGYYSERLQMAAESVNI